MDGTLLKRLKKSPFDKAYATSKGVSGRMLSYFVGQGQLVRLAHGVYAFPEKLNFDFESLVKEKLIQAPQAVIGMKSALRLYDLTEEGPAVIDLMVPASNVPKKKMEDVKLHSVIDHLFEEGITKIGGIPATTLERTVVDILRKKGTPKQGRDIIVWAQKKGIKFNFSEFERLSTIFKIKWKFMNIVMNL